MLAALSSFAQDIGETRYDFQDASASSSPSFFPQGSIFFSLLFPFPLPLSPSSPLSLRPSCRTMSVLSLSSQQSQLRRVRHQTTTAYASSSSSSAAAVAASGARVAFESSGHGCRWSGGVFRDPGWRGRCILPPSVHRYRVCVPSLESSEYSANHIDVSLGGRTDSLCRPCVTAKKRCWPEIRPPLPPLPPLGTLSVERAEWSGRGANSPRTPCLHLHSLEACDAL